MKYGCINEDGFSFQSPRAIEGDEFETMADAFSQALQMLEDGIEKVSVCKCQYYGEDGNGYWGEIRGHGQISIDAGYCEWISKENEENEVEA